MKSLFWMIGGILLAGCAGSAGKGNVKEVETEKAVAASTEMVGADRDEHGCIGSAGYTWSEVRKDCIRLFEVGIRTEAVDGSGQVMYVVFSPDSLKAELFSSESEGSEVLERRTLPSGGHVWNVEDDDTKNPRTCATPTAHGSSAAAESLSSANPKRIMTPIWVLGRSFTTKASFRQPIVRASVIRSPSATASTAATAPSNYK